jgi:hypothetical protein
MQWSSNISFAGYSHYQRQCVGIENEEDSALQPPPPKLEQKHYDAPTLDELEAKDIIRDLASKDHFQLLLIPNFPRM